MYVNPFLGKCGKKNWRWLELFSTKNLTKLTALEFIFDGRVARGALLQGVVTRYVKLGNKGEGGGRVQGLEAWGRVLKPWYQGRVEGNGEGYGYR